MVANALETITRRFGTYYDDEYVLYWDLVHFLCEENGIHVQVKVIRRPNHSAIMCSRLKRKDLTGPYFKILLLLAIKSPTKRCRSLSYSLLKNTHACFNEGSICYWDKAEETLDRSACSDL
jgi:hypothetical protein